MVQCIVRIQIFSTNVGQSTFSLLRKKKKKKYNHFKTFLKHLTLYTIDFVMKKHDIFDKTLMKTCVVELSSHIYFNFYLYKIIQYNPLNITKYISIYINILTRKKHNLINIQQTRNEVNSYHSNTNIL